MNIYQESGTRDSIKNNSNQKKLDIFFWNFETNSTWLKILFELLFFPEVRFCFIWVAFGRNKNNQFWYLKLLYISNLIFLTIIIYICICVCLCHFCVFIQIIFRFNESNSTQRNDSSVHNHSVFCFITSSSFNFHHVFVLSFNIFYLFIVWTINL